MKKLKLSLLCIFAAVICCAVAAFVSIHFISEAQKYIDQPETSTEISAPERDLKATATSVAVPTILSTTAYTVSGTTATANWTGSQITMPVTNNYNPTYMTVVGSSSTPAVSGTNPGSYSLTISLNSGYIWADGTTSAKTYTLKIVKTVTYTITATGCSINGTTATITYTGTSHALVVNVNDASACTASGGNASGMSNAPVYTATNVGSYSVVITLNNTTHYKWSDGTTAPKTFTLKITAKSISDLTVSFDEQTYSGSAKTPVPTIMYGNISLANGTDFTCGTYSNNVNAGTASLVITGKGNYSGTRTVNFTIAKASQTAAITSTATTVVYGNTLTMTGTGTGTLSWSSSNTEVATVNSSTGVVTPVKAGTVTITLTAAGNDNYKSATAKEVITVKRKAIAIPTLSKGSGALASATVSGQSATTTYTGSAQYFTISSTTNITFSTPTAGSTRSNASFYATNAGDYSLEINIDSTKYCWGTVDGGLDYSKKYLSLKINRATVTSELSSTDLTYSTSAQTITLSNYSYVTTTLPTGWSRTDDKITIPAKTNVGNYTVVITPDSNHCWSGGAYTARNVSVTISAKSISAATFSAIAAQTYTGSAIEPTPTVSLGGVTLVVNTDFVFSYEDNINAGSATIIITGTGNYNKEAQTTFTINGKDISGATIGTITNQTYDGTDKKPTATVTDGTTTLSSGTDFEYSYSDNKNAGTATLIITGTGNYTGSTSKNFTIDPRNISEATVAAVADQAYTGSAKTPVPTLTDLSKTLTHDADYTYTYQDNVDVGTAKITIAGMGNYTGTKEVTFTITARNISSVTVAAIGTYYYDGTAKEPTPAVTDGGNTLVDGTDFTFSYRNNVDVGTATLVLTGMGNYTGVKEVSFSIQPPTIVAATVTLSQMVFTYDGTAKEPRVTSVQIGSVSLNEGTDFTVSYASNINAGTAKVVLTGLGDYAGTKDVSFTINPADMSNATINGLLLTYTYTGTVIEPSVTVTFGGKPLILNTDYLLTYANNINVGTATVTATGSKNYTGTLTDSFTIVAENINNATVSGIDATYDYNGSAIEPLPVVYFGSLLLVKDTDYTISYSDNINLGTATITINGIGNFTGKATATFKIVPADIANATVSGVNASYGYTGTAIEPVPAVELNGVVLVLGTDFTVTYTDNVNKGTATLTITGCGNYTGSVSVSFVIGEGDINDAVVSGIDPEYEYTGSAVAPVPMVIYNSLLLIDGVDYTVNYTPNVDLGTVTVTISGIGNFISSITLTFVIVQADISKAQISGIDEHYDYTGSAITPEPIVTLNGAVLVKGTDYTVTYRNNLNIGAGIVVVTGVGNYTSVNETAFTIEVADITQATVTGIDPEYQWTGNAIEPLPAVELNGVVLVKDTDYTLTFTDNTSVGIASYTITGMGNYTGSFTGTFEIVKAELKVTIGYSDWNGTDKLFVGNLLPEITATATYNGATVSGTVEWDLVDGLSPALINGTNDYSWTFTPNDTDNYAVIRGVEKLAAEYPQYIAIRAEWKDGVQPELFTSTSVSVILQNLKVMGIFNDGNTAEILGGFTFVGDWDNTGATSTVNMPTTGGSNFRITVYFGNISNTLSVDVEIKDVVLTELKVNDADGGIKTDYTALDTFDTSSVVVTAKYNDGAEKTVDFGNGGYSVVYENGNYLQYGDTKVTLSFTENGVTKTALIDNISVSKKVHDEALILYAEDTDYSGKSVAEGIKIENKPAWLDVTYIYKDGEGNEIDASEVKNAGTYTVTAKFTVDSNHEEVADITVTFTINKIDPTITPSVGGNFSSGTSLSELSISAGNDATVGTITWDNESFELRAGINRCYYTFTPDDTVNYKTVHGYVDITAESPVSPVTAAGGSVTGWQIALIIICIIIAIIATTALVLALKMRKVSIDEDGFYDDVTDADLL